MQPKTGFGQRQNVVASQAFEQVAAYFAQAKAVIVDVRYNPGGSDDVALTYAGSFTPIARPVFTKTTRTQTGYTAPFTAHLTPQVAQITVPTLLLTGPYTGSAAEVFTLAMRELPQVTVMGAATDGGLSDIMSVTLPNQWQFGFSHQIYTTMHGENFERVGITPDITLDLAPTAATDLILLHAIEYLEQNDTPE